MEAKLAKGIAWKNWSCAFGCAALAENSHQNAAIFGREAWWELCCSHTPIFVPPWCWNSFPSLRNVSLGFPLQEKGDGNCWKKRLGELQESCASGKLCWELESWILEQSGAGGFPWSSSVSPKPPQTQGGQALLLKENFTWLCWSLVPSWSNSLPSQFGMTSLVPAEAQLCSLTIQVSSGRQPGPVCL